MNEAPRGYRYENQFDEKTRTFRLVLVQIEQNNRSSWRSSVQSLTDLRSFHSDSVQDKDIRFIEDTRGIWTYDSESSQADDGSTSIAPSDQPLQGRWLLLPTSGGGSGPQGPVGPRGPAGVVDPSLLTSEINTRAQADATIVAMLNAETTARVSADDSLRTALLAPPDQAGLLMEATTRAAADETESSARLSADTLLAQMINAEATSRMDGDASLSTAIQNLVLAAPDQIGLQIEATTRASADSALADGLSAEINTRAQADATIVAMLNDLQQRVATLESKVP